VQCKIVLALAERDAPAAVFQLEVALYGQAPLDLGARSNLYRALVALRRQGHVGVAPLHLEWGRPMQGYALTELGRAKAVALARDGK
jgi:hypothetical protein